MLPQLDKQNFKRMFRVPRATLQFIVEKCQEKVERMNTNMRDASGKMHCIRPVQTMFLCGGRDYSPIVRRGAIFCGHALPWVLRGDCGGNGSKLDKNVGIGGHGRPDVDIDCRDGIRQAIAATDGCRFAVTSPKEHAAGYINYKAC